jgi:polyisoprenoid-binding protein YceI
MHVALTPSSRATIELRATGILRALGHDVTLAAPVGAWEADVGEASAIDVPVEVTIPVSAIEPPADLPASDREKMIDNLREPAVLDAKRWPAMTFRGRYRGTLDAGTLEGELEVRGAAHTIAMPIRVTRTAEQRLHARGEWTGTLNALGVKPFKALLGGLRLEDWACIRVDVEIETRV